MSTPLDSFDELTDFGVMGRPELADILDSQEVKVLEERFLAKGTVVVTKDGSILQAVHVRGSSRAREVWFAPSSSSRQTLAANKIRASEVYTAGDLTHVFMNLGRGTISYHFWYNFLSPVFCCILLCILLYSEKKSDNFD